MTATTTTTTTTTTTATTTTSATTLHNTAPHYNYNHNYMYNNNHITTTLRCLQPLVGPSVGSLCRPWFTTTNVSYRFPIFETSATALCGTIVIFIYMSIVYTYLFICIHNSHNAHTPQTQVHESSIRFFMYSLVHSLIHSFLHSFIPSFLHSFFPSFLHSFIPSFLHSFIHSFTHSLTHSFTLLNSLLPSFLPFLPAFLSFIPSFLHSFLPSCLPFLHSFIPSILHPLIHSFLHSFISSFVHAFIIHSFIVHSCLAYSRCFMWAADVSCFQQPGRPYNVLICWTGSDGSILQPVTLAVSETLTTITADLDGLIDRMVAVRGQRGLASRRPSFRLCTGSKL